MKANYAPKQYILMTEHKRLMQEAIRQATADTIQNCSRFMFMCTALAVKDCGYSDRNAEKIMRRAYSTYQSVANGDVTFKDIEQTMKEEYELTFQWEDV